MQLILASASPRRKALLSLFGIPFTVRAADIDETMDPEKPPFDEVARVSRSKALAVRREEEDVVIAADTIVVCQGKVLGKPHSEDEAASMLRLLSGRDHQVMTGCTILYGDRVETFTEVTSLHFRPLSEKEQEGYFHLLSKRNRLLAKMVCRTPGLFAMTYRLYEKLFRREEEH